MSDVEGKERKKEVSLGWVLFVLGFLFVSMAISVLWLNIPVHMTLVANIIVAGIVAMRAGFSWMDIQEAIKYGAGIAMIPMLILMIIGVVIGAWIASGTIQTIIYYGLLILRPSYFLVAAAIIVGLASMSTGSSYTSGGTVGVAMMGIGMGLGVSPAMTAGAVISGAILGDKMSPLSDSTNLAAAVGESDLFAHIRSMMYTTVPAFLIALILFAVMGLFQVAGAADTTQVDVILETLRTNYMINPIMLIPPVVVIIMARRKAPSLPTMIIAALVASVLAMIFQGANLTSVTNVMMYGFVGETGVADVDALVSRGGLFAMMWTVSLGFIGVAFGGILEKTRMLEVFLGSLASVLKNTSGLITTTVVSGILLNLATASQYMAIIITGRMMVPEYRKKNIHSSVLSRTLEDSGTVFSPLVPWGLCGVYFAGTLGVPTLEYFPYVFLALFVPVIAVIFAFTGLAVWYGDEETCLNPAKKRKNNAA